MALYMARCDNLFRFSSIASPEDVSRHSLWTLLMHLLQVLFLQESVLLYGYSYMVATEANLR